jgi:hypothetical protein
MLLTLDEALADPERQDSEFKTSTAETSDAAQALVGFANSRGGQVFFGVTDDRVPIGIELGRRTVEDLGDKLDKRIYPSLPLEFDDFPGHDGKRVVRVWTPADKPPIVGGYVYSKRSLNPDDRVALARTQAYRRVGRQTRKVDFMWLRGVLASDPLVIIDTNTAGSVVQNDLVVLRWLMWHVSGGVALDLTVTTDPPLGAAGDPIKDLLGAAGVPASGELWLNLAQFHASVDLQEVSGGKAGQYWLVVRYRDLWSCEWESRRRINVRVDPPVSFPIDTEREPILIPRASTSSTPEFSYGLVSLPPKRLASPT